MGKKHEADSRRLQQILRRRKLAVSSQRAAIHLLRCRRIPYMRDDILIAASREAHRSGSVSWVAHFRFHG